MLLFGAEYLLVVDDLRSPDESTFDWLYHNRGDKAVCAAAQKKSMPGELDGKQYLGDVAGGVTDGGIHVSFPGQDVATELVAAGADGTEVYTSDGPVGSVEDRAAVVILRRRSRAALFAATIEPVAQGAQRLVTEVTCRQVDDRLSVTVHWAGGADRIRLASDGSFRVFRSGREVLTDK